MTDLYGYEAPDGVEVLIAWLSELCETRSERPTGSVLPFIQVNRIGGADDGLVDKGVYSIHVFNTSAAETSLKAREVHRRLRLLAGCYTGQQKVTISTGDVYVDNVECQEGFHQVPYLDVSIPEPMYRFVGTYQVQLRYQAVS